MYFQTGNYIAATNDGGLAIAGQGYVPGSHIDAYVVTEVCGPGFYKDLTLGCQRITFLYV